jgi:hypothetical protein
MELNKLYVLPPETMKALEDPRNELVAGITGELVFTLERKVGPGFHPQIKAFAEVPADGYGIVANQFTCYGKINLDKPNKFPLFDKVGVIFQGWKSGDCVKVTGPIGWSIQSEEPVKAVSTFTIDLFLRDKVEGIITKVDVK